MDSLQERPFQHVSKGPHNQLATVIEHPVIQEIETLNIDEMTPLEALNKLHLLKKKIASSSSSSSLL